MADQSGAEKSVEAMDSPTSATDDLEGQGESAGAAKKRSPICRILASRRLPEWCVLVSLALTLPAILAPLELDDFFHRAILSGRGKIDDMGGPQSMMCFFDADPESARQMLERGFFPWWADPELKAEFLQLITVQTHILDYALWPNLPELMHLQSMLWLAAGVGLVAVFYRRVLGATWAAGLAALAFAVEDAHATPAALVCNRNVLLCLTFGAGSLICHDLWRRDGKRWALAPALLLWACSLLSKEEGISTCAYLGAYAFFLDRGKWLPRLATLVPYGVVLVVWRSVRDALGFGIAHMGLYVDPIDDPGRFAAALLERGPVLLLGQWAFPPAEVYSVLHHLYGGAILTLAWACLIFLFVLFLPLLRRDRVARFFACGMILSVIPVCAAFPMNRLLVFTGIGAVGLLARFWQALWGDDCGESVGPAPTLPTGRWYRAFAWTCAVLLALIHLVLAPVLLVFNSANPTGPRVIRDSLYLHAAFGPEIAEQDLILVNPPSQMHAAYVSLTRAYDGLPIPRGVRMLAPGLSPIEIERTDERTLVIAAEGGYMNWVLDRLFRNEVYPISAGYQVELDGFTVTVLEVTHDGRPLVASFEFAEPLESESYRWLYWMEGRFLPWTPIAIGQKVRMAPPELGRMLRGNYKPTLSDAE